MTDGQPGSSIDFSDNNNFIKHAKKVIIYFVLFSLFFKIKTNNFY